MYMVYILFNHFNINISRNQNTYYFGMSVLKGRDISYLYISILKR